MGHFAKVENGKVTDVISAEQDVIDSGAFGDSASWVQTSYNTFGGVHLEPDSETPSADQTKALRKNFACIGYTYDSTRDAFYAPQPYPSWVLNETTCLWNPPIPYPDDYPEVEYNWDEDNQAWVLRNNGGE